MCRCSPCHPSAHRRRPSTTPTRATSRQCRRRRFCSRISRWTSRRRRPRQEITQRSEEHTSELQSQSNLVCRLLLEKKKTQNPQTTHKQTIARITNVKNKDLRR